MISFSAQIKWRFWNIIEQTSTKVSFASGFVTILVWELQCHLVNKQFLLENHS